MLTQCSSCSAPFSCGASNFSEACWCTAKAKVAIDQNQASCVCEPCLEKRIQNLGEYSSFRFMLAYRGTHFAGFQAQAEQRTVEGEFKRALKSIIHQDFVIQAAGRTDSGVHAHGQVISAQFFTRMSLRQLSLALATKLPHDMAVWRIDKMPGAFDARRQSIGKQYIYRIAQSLVVDPFVREQVWHIRGHLDVESMRDAAKYLVGEHDFHSFRSSLCGAAHAVRYLWHLSVMERGDLLEIDVRGNAFCLNMVRIIVGTLVDVGRGKIQAPAIEQILLAKDRNRAGRTAPAQGLSFNKVYYPDNLTEAQIPLGAIFPRYPVTKESWPFDNTAVLYGP
jgi:tRNA pseudouridine38-40 synthase